MKNIIFNKDVYCPEHTILKGTKGVVVKKTAKYYIIDTLTDVNQSVTLRMFKEDILYLEQKSMIPYFTILN